MPQNFDFYITVSGTGVYFGEAKIALSPAATKISSFAALPQGWDYGSGGPVSRDVISLALAWNDRLHRLGFLNTNASAGTDGEVAIGAGLGDHYVEIIVEADNSVSVVYDFRRRQIFHRPRLSDVDAHQAMLEIVGQIWSASTSFTQASTTEMKIGGSELRSGTIGGLYQFSGANALQTTIQQYATISETTATSSSQEWSESLQYFGDLTPIFYQPEAA